MDEVILGHWQNIKSGDTFYILGDLALSKSHAKRALGKLPRGVQVHYVFGNHDSRIRSVIGGNKHVTWAGDLKGIKVQAQYIVLCHYAMRTWNMTHHGSWQLFGHSHNALHPWERQLDVGVDSAAKLVGEYRPLSFEEIAGFIADGMNPKILAKRFGKSPSWVGGDHHDSMGSDDL
jgi:calcineurin-like phosphoesterase family protein